MNTRAAIAKEVAKLVRDFIPREQALAINEICRTKEGREEMSEPLTRLLNTIKAMPKVYEQESMGEQAIAHLHYFTGSCDWWITEKDVDSAEGQIQAFGLAQLNGDTPELGYISIKELCAHRMMNVDLYWTPITVAEIKGKREHEDRQQAEESCT